jgi:integrase
MPPPKPKQGTKIVRKVLADGTVRTYRYARKPKGARITPYGPGTIGAALIAYKRSPEWDGLAAGSRKIYTLYLKPIERMAAVPLRNLKRSHLYGLRDAIAKKRGHGAATAFVRSAQAWLTWCLRRDLIEHSPAHRLEPLPGGHLAAWSEAEARAAMAALPAHLGRVVLLGMHTGQRRGDLCRLPWSAYDGATLRLTQQKTGKALVIPVSPELRAALDAWKREATSTTILADAAGKPWNVDYLTAALPDAMVAAGLPRLPVHGLRKLAAAMLADASCTPHEIAAITGHDSLAMISLYTKSANQERLAKAAVVKLETARDGNRGNRRRNG